MLTCEPARRQGPGCDAGAAASIRRWTRPGDTAIDVGANIGYYTLLAAGLAGPHGRVIAIEPSPAFCQALTGAVRAQRLAQIRAVRAAVSDASTRLAFYQPEPGNLGHTTTAEPGPR